MYLVAKRGQVHAGFLDPAIVTQDNIKADRKNTGQYLKRALINGQDKAYFMLPFNKNFHWILLVIEPSENKVVYLDSMRMSTTHEWEDLKGLLNAVFKSYVKGGGKHNAAMGMELRHIEKFPVSVYSHFSS